MPPLLQGPLYQQASLCEPILRSLPGWFGIEASILNYLAEMDYLPTFLARDADQVAGFLTLKQHTPYAAEIYVMGLLPAYHHHGLGRVLVHQAEAWLRGQGVEYLQVKTLSPSDPDENYAKTRTFYTAVGFRPLEELPQLWGSANPCLIMIKRL